LCECTLIPFEGPKNSATDDKKALPSSFSAFSSSSSKRITDGVCGKVVDDVELLDEDDEDEVDGT
jgi:hypothetical protein